MDKIISLINMDGPLADKETAKQVARTLFEYYDRDNSGTIEKHEMGKNPYFYYYLAPIVLYRLTLMNSD